MHDVFTVCHHSVCTECFCMLSNENMNEGISDHFGVWTNHVQYFTSVQWYTYSTVPLYNTVLTMPGCYPKLAKVATF